MIVVAGCVAQAEGEEVLRRQRAVDLVVGPQSYHRLSDLLTRAEAGERVAWRRISLSRTSSRAAPGGGEGASRGVAAFITAQEGCDKFCSFCVVPYTRGAEVSRRPFEIVEEAEALAAAGVRELTIIGQNVNAYKGMGEDGGLWSLPRLLERLGRIEGLTRLRYTTSHPIDMTQELIDAHAELPTLGPFMHLPVQSGSDRILKAMNSTP